MKYVFGFSIGSDCHPILLHFIHSEGWLCHKCQTVEQNMRIRPIHPDMFTFLYPLLLTFPCYSSPLQQGNLCKQTGWHHILSLTLFSCRLNLLHFLFTSSPHCCQVGFVWHGTDYHLKRATPPNPSIILSLQLLWILVADGKSCRTQIYILQKGVVGVMRVSNCNQKQYALETVHGPTYEYFSVFQSSYTKFIYMSPSANLNATVSHFKSTYTHLI